MNIENTTFYLICSVLILLATTISSVCIIVNTVRNPVKKIEEKNDAKLRDKICTTLKEVLPEILKEHDLETKERYKADRERYLNEIKSSVLTDTQNELNQVKLLGVQYESLVISAKDILREKIIKIYIDNKDEKRLSVLERERLDQFYRDYKSLKGNSYIDKYYNRMIKWEIDDDDYDDEEIYSEYQELKASFLKSKNIFETNCYYEIIEEDQAGNYRVYGVYIPNLELDRIDYSYQTNSNTSSRQDISIIYNKSITEE